MQSQSSLPGKGATADLAFGTHTVWPALNSTFGDRALMPNQGGLLARTTFA